MRACVCVRVCACVCVCVGGGGGIGGLWLGRDKIYLILPQRLCSILIIPPDWELVGSQFSIVSHLYSVGDN